MSELVTITTADHVLTITWNAPERLNSLDAAMLDAAAEAIESRGDDVRAVLITGTGKAFSSGAALSGEFDGDATLVGANRLIRAITRAEVPVVAGVNGLAAGVGVSIALAADLAVVRRSAFFLLAFVNIGLMPDGGATELVAAAVGRARANRLAMLGERLPADDALTVGLIHDVVDDDAYDDAVTALVTRLATGPTRALAEMKKAITAATLPTLDETLDREYAGQVSLFDTHDSAEGAQAFRDKRPAEFTGR